MNKLNEKKKELAEEQAENLEKLIRDHLPEGAKVEDLRAVHNKYVKGATTVLHKGEPLISVFPLEFNEKTKEDGSIVIEVTRQYYNHKEEEDEKS